MAHAISLSLFSGVARETHSPKRWPLVACTVCAALSGPSGLSPLLLGIMLLFMAHAVPSANVLCSWTACKLSAAGGYCPAAFFNGFYHICVAMGANELAPLHFGCVTTSFYSPTLLLILYFLSVFAYILLSLLSLISILHQVVCSCETASFISSNSWVTYSSCTPGPGPKKVSLYQGRFWGKPWLVCIFLTSLSELATGDATL